MFSLYWKPSPFGPAPKSKLFCNGTLMSAATGLASFLASSAASSLAAVDSAPPIANGRLARTISRRCFVFTIPSIPFQMCHGCFLRFLFKSRLVFRLQIDGHLLDLASELERQLVLVAGADR